jgi:multisubunit Na+/H+ antiporter MnhB subunit
MAVADLLLFGTLVVIGAAGLVARDVRAAATLFIAFGLLLALAWVRLAAPDVALAEAAIGAGVTGALLLDAAARLHGAPHSARAPNLFAGGLLCAALAAALALAAFALAPTDGTATWLAAERLAETEVAHPVTAVLLAFRAYDTLLEIGVLLAAVVAGQALAAPAGVKPPSVHDTVLTRVAGVTLPVAVLVAVYLLWAGATRTGGAFQAGAVLAGALLLARFASVRFVEIATPVGRRAALGAGFAAFIVVAAAAGVAAGAVLAYPTGWSGALILAVEAALMVSIAASLAALFGSGAPR